MLGANGAGKTTTLRVISGLVRPMRGRVAFAGEDLARVSPTRRAQLGIAHVPEGRGIFFGLTVAEHFRLGHRREQLDAELAYDYFPLLRELRTRRRGSSRAASSRCSQSAARSRGSRGCSSSTS